MKRSFSKNMMLIAMLVFGMTSIIQAQTGLDAVQLAKIETVGSVYLSEDGKTGAYTLSVPADPMVQNTAAATHLYLLDIKSGESTALVTDVSVGSVAFRPGTGTLTYLAKKEGEAP